MAKTWRTGEFGLTSFDDHNLEFNELIQHFNDNINENFDDLSIVSDISTADIQIALDVVLQIWVKMIYLIQILPWQVIIYIPILLNLLYQYLVMRIE